MTLGKERERELSIAAVCDLCNEGYAENNVLYTCLACRKREKTTSSGL